MMQTGQLPRRAGASFKPEHFQAIIENKPEVGFFEVHAENYMGAGGLPHRILRQIAETYPISIHGVGLSIGAEKPLDADHLDRLKTVVERYKPAMVSEHLAWSTHDSFYYNDLLPLPYTEKVLARVVEHIDQVQTALDRQILMENPSTYVAFAESEMEEVTFITEMQKRSGCGLLLDVNNVHVSATNQKYDARAYIDAYSLAHVGEIHLGGHAIDADDNGEILLIDAHDREVSEEVWALYEYMLTRSGPVPTLVEWDNDLPEWAGIYSDVRAAQALLDAAERRSDAA